MKELRENTLEILNKIYSLPGRSAKLVEISDLINDPNTTNNELAELIRQDQAVSAKVLAIANSPMFGLRRSVATVEFAVMVIGYSQIKNIVLALVIMDSFKTKSDEYFDQKLFWNHCMSTAAIAKKIAIDLKLPIADEAFVAGMLHDMGITVINKYIKDEFDIISKRINDGNNAHTTELECLGISHAEIAKVLCDKWALPRILGETVFHHNGVKKAGEFREIASVINIADFISNEKEASSFLWDKEIKLNENCWKYLGFSEEEKFTEYLDEIRGWDISSMTDFFN